MQSTYIMLIKSFPDGISQLQYGSLIKILYDHMSDRNLATVLAEITKKNYEVVLNDIYRIAGNNLLFEDENSVLSILIANGFNLWIEED